MRLNIFLCIFLHEIFVNSMELKSIHSCQISLLTKSKILTSSTTMISNTWCPSSLDKHPYILLSLTNLTYITRLNIKSTNFYYHIEYTRDYSIDHSTLWRSYRLLNTNEENLLFDPPIIAKHIRLNIKQLKINICFKFDLFGCIFTDGVVSYNMLQGINQLEDDTYDGSYNDKHRYLYNGLGQLSDGQTGPDDYTDPQGFQWVGWRKSRHAKSNNSIGILFKFDRLRNFSRLTIHANNYFPKKIYVFRSITIEFLHNKTQSSSMIKYDHQRDDQFEMARPIMIDLKYQIASELKIHLYFDQNWILISEFTFDSVIIQHENYINKHISFSILSISMLIITLCIIPSFILILLRCLFKKPKSTSFNSSLSTTTSSDIDTNSSHHRYSTIRSFPSSPYAKLILPSSINYHIEGICGNSIYGSERSFSLNFNENLFISNKRIHRKNRIENKYQIIGGGEIYQGDLQVNQRLIPITIRTLLSNASAQTKISFFNEISLLTSLCHSNIVHAYGYCSDPSLALIMESFDNSTIDLYQYLKREKFDENNFYSIILIFARQVSSALAYLESLQIYHRDLAARNCLITSNFNIKLHDLAICNELYANDYVLITIDNNNQTRRPIRWCAWETICLNRFTSKSDVFSFGILLWEMLTMANRPHHLLTDEQVLMNIQNSYHYLDIPNYAGDLKELILSCWKKYDYERPSFVQINYFLCQKEQFNKIDHNYQQIDI